MGALLHDRRRLDPKAEGGPQWLPTVDGGSTRIPLAKNLVRPLRDSHSRLTAASGTPAFVKLS